jgi:hypothetical protein
MQVIGSEHGASKSLLGYVAVAFAYAGRKILLRSTGKPSDMNGREGMDDRVSWSMAHSRRTKP